MEVKKILWPTDFSPNAEKALDYVTSLSQKYQTEVHVLYVIQELAQHPPWYGDLTSPISTRSRIGRGRRQRKDSTKSAKSICRAARSTSSISPQGIRPRRSSS